MTAVTLHSDFGVQQNKLLPPSTGFRKLVKVGNIWLFDVK